MIVLMLFVSRTLAGRCGRYFVAQQLAIGKVTGYIEERLSGQKVIKVFNHEEETGEEFDKLMTGSMTAHSTPTSTPMLLCRSLPT